MQNVYWFLDSVPTHDLGLTKDTISSGKDYYVIGGIAGQLPSIIGAYKNLGLTKDSKGYKLVKNPQWLHLANTVLNTLIDSGKMIVFGTIFYHSQIPMFFKQSPEKYVSSDNPEEKGIIGMQGRVFAQTVWIFMEHVLKRNLDINPIVWLDNEDPVILQSVNFHIKPQLATLRPEAEVKVQSRNLARENENIGHNVSDAVCSVIGNYVKFPDKYGIFEDLIKKIIKFDSWIEQIPGTNLGNIITIQVQQWALEAKLTHIEEVNYY